MEIIYNNKGDLIIKLVKYGDTYYERYKFYAKMLVNGQPDKEQEQTFIKTLLEHQKKENVQ